MNKKRQGSGYNRVSKKVKDLTTANERLKELLASALDELLDGADEWYRDIVIDDTLGVTEDELIALGVW